MKREELIKLGCLVPYNVLEAMKGYPHTISDGIERTLQDTLSSYLSISGGKNVYLDFYFGTLSAQEQETVCSVLTRKEFAWLQEQYFPAERSQVYFPYEKMLFQIAVKLSAGGMLLSTFYFPVIGKTVWSSFDGNFVVFDYEGRRQNEEDKR